jgi:orotate phosphoribosyltransferase
MDLLDHQIRFLELAREVGALRFGDFELKSGRRSPYFFDAGAFSSGPAFAGLGSAYAAAVESADLRPDVLFGPAYKGIALATVTATALHLERGRSVGVCYNRKEAKRHGEGGRLVGAPLEGRVVIVDDVLTAGTAVREVIGLFPPGVRPAGVVLALDRQERVDEGPDRRSAARRLEDELGVPVISIAGLDTLLGFLERSGDDDRFAALRSYRERYGAD